MPMSRKFLTEFTGEKILKIGQYLAKIWTRYEVFWATLYIFHRGGTGSMVGNLTTFSFIGKSYVTL